MHLHSLSDLDFTKLANGSMKRVNDKKADWKIDQTAIDVITPLLDDWNKKIELTINPKMTTSADTEAKNLARKALSPALSSFYTVWIFNNKNMNDADIVSCGLTPHKTTHTAVGKPKTLPEMDYKAGNAHSLHAYFHQQPGTDGVSHRGKPDGVGHIQVAYFIGDNPPVDPNDLPKTVIFTKTPGTIDFAPADAGKNVHLAARWVSTSNLNGDWSKIEKMMIP